MMFTLLIAAGWTIAQAQSTPAQRIGLTLEDNRSVYTTVGERNQYENDLRLSQPTGDYQLTAGLLYNGDNNIVLHRIDDQGEDTECARINLNAVVTGGALPSIEVTPTVSYWNGENWGSPYPLGDSRTYAPNDTIDLYGLGTITDAFDANTDENSHSDYYTYKVTLDGNIILPSGDATGLGFNSSTDFSACTSSDPASATIPTDNPSLLKKAAHHQREQARALHSR